MAIVVTPKPKIKAPIWIIVLLAFAIVAILGFLVSYFYLDRSIKKISEKIEEKERALKEIPSEEQKAMEDELLLYEAKIDGFGELLSEHKKTLNIFNFLERVCHPKIWFSKFNFDSGKGVIDVSGEAEGFIAVEQQILILKREISFLENINLSEISMGEEGGVTFTLRLTLDPQIFTR